MKTPNGKKKEILRKRAIIQELSKKGSSIAEISRQTGMTRKCVKRWMNRETIFDNPKPQRTKKITESVEKFIEDKMRDKIGVRTRKVVKSLNKEFESAGSTRQISRRIVQRYLKATDWGNIVRRIKNKPFLTKKTLKIGLIFAKLLKMLDI